MATTPRRYAISLKLILASYVWAVTASSIGAQSTGTAKPIDTEEEIRLLREEVLALRSEVNSLKQELHTSAPQSAGTDRKAQYVSAEPAGAQAYRPSGTTSTGQSNTPSTASGAEQQSDLADTVSLVQSQVAEQAQTKVESSSKLPVKIYGTILSSTFFNTRDTDWADIPFLVNPPSAFNAGWFSSSLRQSRIGIEVNGPTIGQFKTTGVFAMDFLGGMTDFQATPLFGLPEIVYAYARLESERTAIEAGQDEMILAPRNPTSLVAFSYPELYHTGNLYLRAPQIRVERRLAGSKEGQLRATLGLVTPIGTYPTLDFPGGSVTNGWKRPAVQARIGWQSAPPGSAADQPGWALGVSGHYGRVALPQVNSSGNVVSSFSQLSWAGALDFDIHSRHLGVDAEGYIGKNLQSLGGGIGQPGRTLGGYFEGRFIATQRLQFNAGLGDDRLTKPDRISVLLNRNTAVFANTIYQFTPEVRVSLEYRHMITRPFDGTTRHNNNVNLGIAYSF